MIFEPKREDGRPIWRLVYDYLEDRIVRADLKAGDPIPHTILRELLAEDERKFYYSVVGKAAKELREKHKRSLESIRGVGYRLIAGVAQVEQGQSFQKRAKRSLNKGLMVMKSSDRGLMSPEDRTWADKVENGMVALASIARQHDEKLIVLGQQMEQIHTSQYETNLKQTATEAELAEIKRKLANLERGFGKSGGS